jgi:hypothetical protein
MSEILEPEALESLAMGAIELVTLGAEEVIQFVKEGFSSEPTQSTNTSHNPIIMSEAKCNESPIVDSIHISDEVPEGVEIVNVPSKKRCWFCLWLCNKGDNKSR